MRPPLTMEISEASLELPSTDKLLHVFRVPIVRKTFKCAVYKINCLTTAHKDEICNSALCLPSLVSGFTPPFSLLSFAAPLKGSSWVSLFSLFCEHYFFWPDFFSIAHCFPCQGPVVQSSSCFWLCNPIDWSRPGFPVLHNLPEFAQIYVHWFGDAIQPSHPLSSPSPLALNLSQHQGLFQGVGCSHWVAKVLELQLQHQSFEWVLRVDFLSDWLIWSPCCPRDSQ